MTLADMLRRPELKLMQIFELAGIAGLALPPFISIQAFVDEIELEIKYAGYIKRQEEQILRFKKLERIELPADLPYKNLPGLSNEVVEKLTKIQPRTLGQASRISGVTPAALSVLQIHLKKLGIL